MRVRDSRPPFAGLANLSGSSCTACPPPAICWTKPSCAATAKFCWGCSSAPAAEFCWRRRLFPTLTSTRCWLPIWPVPRPAACTRAVLGREELPEKENHVFCAAYRADEFAELLQYADHIVFNSPSQLAKFGPAAKAAGKSIGLRINPECSTQEGHEIYDPCAPGSRLGTTRAQWDAAVAAHPELPALLDGLHFHTLCEQDADALAVTLAAVEEKFADLLPRMQVAQFRRGTPHHPPGLCPCYAGKLHPVGAAEKYGVQVYLEPGEAWALNAGLSGYHRAGHLAQWRYRALPFWICPQPATPRTSSRCPTARRCWMPARQGRKRTLVRLGRPHLPCGGYHRGLQL